MARHWIRQPGKVGSCEDHQRVERVAVLAEGVLDVAVVGGVAGGGEQHPVQPDPAGLVVHLVLVALTLGDLHQDVELHSSILTSACLDCVIAYPSRTSGPNVESRTETGVDVAEGDAAHVAASGRAPAARRSLAAPYDDPGGARRARGRRSLLPLRPRRPLPGTDPPSPISQPALVLPPPGSPSRRCPADPVAPPSRVAPPTGTRCGGRSRRLLRTRGWAATSWSRWPRPTARSSSATARARSRRPRR